MYEVIRVEILFVRKQPLNVNNLWISLTDNKSVQCLIITVSGYYIKTLKQNDNIVISINLEPLKIKRWETIICVYTLLYM